MAEYFLGGTPAEQQRLLAQAAAHEPEARWLLDRIGVEPGWRAIDVGCGPIGILPLLAERVGPDGSVVGLERDPRFAELARTAMAERGLANVRVVQGDVGGSELPHGSFDLAHERLVLVQAPDPEPILAAMVSLVRPGGIVVAEEFDGQSWFCYPPHPAWTTLMEVYLAIAREAELTGGLIGRRLPEWLRAAGLLDVAFEVHVRAARPGEYHRTHLPALLDSLRDTVLVRGLLTEGELSDLSASLRTHLEDPHTVVVRDLLFQAWGRKPG